MKKPKLYNLRGRLVDMNRCIRIEFGNARRGDSIAGLADVFRVEEELGRKVGDGGRCGIVEGQALDASKSNVLCDFDTETLQTDDEDVGSAHALHGLVSQYIELSAVEGFVDFGSVRDDRVVYLEPGD